MSFQVNVEVKPRMATTKLASGHEMPLVGFGLWKVPQEETADTVYAAIKAGYRLFDGAYDYQNEKQAGEGIRKAISDGLVTRKEIFITTKLWNNYHRKEHVEEMAKFQNETWGLGYIDLFLIHFPVAHPYIPPSELPYPAWWMTADRGAVKLDKVPIRETWEAVESLVDSGLARSIGVSNFSAQLLYDILTYNRRPISALQIEHHPYLTQENLVKMAQEEGIVVTAYSSFGPASFEGMDGKFGDKARETGLLFVNPTVVEIAKKHGKTPAQILLRWATQRNVAVIPKSTNKERLAQNLDVTSGWELTDKEIKDISALNQGLRFNDPSVFLSRPIRIFD